MKKILLFLMFALFCIPWAANAQMQVTIGDLDGATNNSYLPMNSLYNYSYTQQIYTAEEIGMGGTITSITIWMYGNANLYEMPFTIYMVETDKDAFSGNTDWVTVTAADAVYSGSVTVHNTEAQAYTFELSTPFEYTGAGNLLIAFNNTTGQWKSGLNGKVFGASGDPVRAIYARQDSGAYDPFNPTFSAYGTTYQRNVVEIDITPASSGCDMPTSIAVSDITTDGATVTWEGEGSAWTLRYKVSTDEEFTLVEGLTDQTYTFDGTLASNTTYNVGVQNVCAGSSSYFKSTSFTTANACAAPTNLQITDVTTESATLTWTPGYQETEWTVKYKKSTDTVYMEETVNGTPTLTLSHLANLTTYNVQVYNCENSVSGTFTTAAGIPLNEAFNATSKPTGWSMYTGLLSNVMSGTALTPATYGWNFGTNNNVFDSHARVNIYGNYQRWLVMPTLVMEDNVQLTFDMALTVYSSSSSASPTPGNQEDDRFIVLITTDGGTTWEILREWNNTGSEYVYDSITNAATGQTEAINLSGYAGQSIAIAFYGESTVSGGDNNLHIDNVSIDYIPSCAKPTGLTKSDVTAHEATITWTSDAAAWQVQLNDEDPIDVTEATYTFEHLAPETAYTAKVRANCDGTYSEWTNAVSFTTAIACPAPTSFATSNVTNHGATLKWVSSASEWIVAYKVTADEDFTEITVYDTTYTFTDLAPETAYTVKVRANCGDEDGISSWTTTRSFTTLEACPAPNNLTYTDLTVNSVTLSWNERGDATAWDLQYWIGEDTTTVEGITENPYMLTDLTAETVYGARVRSACGSAWSSSVSFEPTAKLVIGSGTATSGYLPTNTNYDYSFTQQIYTVEELGEAGLIESIDFYMTSTSAYTRNLDVYMVLTDKNAFESTSDWIAVTDADMVFSGEVAFAPQSWTTITLTDPFIYDGTQNLAIIVDDNTNVWSSRSFRTFTTSAQQALYMYQDNNDLPITYSGDGTRTTSKNQIRILKNELGDCMKPTGFTASEVTAHSVELSWVENGSSESWYIYYMDGQNGEQSVEVTENPYTLEGLTPETTYEAFVIPSCGVEYDDPDNSLTSTWIEFTTLATCLEPTNAVVTDITGHEATISWTENGDATTWRLYGSEGSDEIEMTVTGEPTVTLTGLTPETVYWFQIFAVCDEDDESSFAEVEFTTGIACPAPTDLTLTNHTDGVTVGWNGTSDNYNVRLGQYSFAQYVDFENNSIPALVNNSSDYPWTIVSGNGGHYVQSSNAGVSSSTSEISVTVTYPEAGVIEFDAECRGEGTSTAWDKCIFDIDGEEQFSYGAHVSGWNHYSYNVTAGTHTFTWSYTKDSSVNPTGDYFAVDNVFVAAGDPTWGEPITVSENSADFALEEAGTYLVQVQANCGAEDGLSSWSEPYSFSFAPSACSIVLNQDNDFTWKETFENITNITGNRWTGVSPDCWTLVDQYTGTADTLPQLFYQPLFNSPEGGNYTLRMHFRYAYAMPVLDPTVNFDNLRLSMYVRQPFWSYKLQIGVMTDLNDESTFVPVAIVNNKSKAVTYFECGFETVKNIVGEERYIVFKNIGGSEGDLYCTNYIDDITLTYRSDEDCEVSLPYVEDFEDITTLTGETGVEPICWDIITEDAVLESVSKPQLYTEFNTTPGGQYTLRMRNRCVYAMPRMSLVSPTVTEGTDLVMTLKVRQPNALYRLQVGVVDDQDNFTPVQTIKCTSTGMQEFTVTIPNFTVGRIAFRNTLVPGNGMSVDYLDYSYNYIDDINIDALDPNRSSENVNEVMDANAALENISVYPNPTTGNLYIDAVGIQKVECYNAMGQLVRVYDNVLNNIDLNNLSEGVYTLRITVPQGVTMRKVVKR